MFSFRFISGSVEAKIREIFRIDSSVEITLMFQGDFSFRGLQVLANYDLSLEDIGIVDGLNILFERKTANRNNT
jgi:hypothetical protein